MAWRTTASLMGIMRIDMPIVASGFPIIIRSPGTMLMEDGAQRTALQAGPPVMNIGGAVADMYLDQDEIEILPTCG